VNRGTIAIVGGTGPQGKGLGYRFALAGWNVVLGSRDDGRAAATADELTARMEGSAGSVIGATNVKAAEAADLVLLAVPFDGHHDLVRDLGPHLASKVVISCVNPLGFDKAGPYGLDLGPTSAAETAQELLPEARLVGAFHHLSAVALLSGAPLDHEDVLVVGDDREAKAIVTELAAAVTGKPGIDAGPLRLARQLEPLTAVLISINRQYKVRSGIAVAGLR
jgi:NADPH-dependent F420 reductase